MLGPKNYPTALQMVNYETDLVKHQRKLQQIHKNTKSKEYLDHHANEKVKLFEVRERGQKFHNMEKHNAIEKDNEILLGKLVEIARKKKTAADFKSDKHHIGTLNAPHRKREKDRIAAENEAFARRLLSQQPSFNRKKLETDYEKHNSRVKQMQKVPLHSPRKFKLPPIEEAEMRKSQSGGALRDTKADKKKNQEKEKKEAVEIERIEKEQAELKEKQEREERERKEEQERREQEEKEKTIREEAERKEKEAEQQELQRILSEKPAQEDQMSPTQKKQEPIEEVQSPKNQSKNDIAMSPTRTKTETKLDN